MKWNAMNCHGLAFYATPSSTEALYHHLSQAVNNFQQLINSITERLNQKTYVEQLNIFKLIVAHSLLAFTKENKINCTDLSIEMVFVNVLTHR